jgi:hypothetical protein
LAFTDGIDLNQNLPIEPLQKIHKLTFPEAAKLSIYEMRHLWLLNAQKVSNLPLFEIPHLENFLDLKTELRSCKQFVCIV